MDVEYLMLGHVVKDVADHGYRFGGTVSFAGVTALRLGAKLGVVTAVSAEDRPSVQAIFPGALMHWVESPVTTVYENIYQSEGRTQYCRALGTSITVDKIPSEWLKSPIVHLGPLTGEVPAEMTQAVDPGSLIGVTPQGWLRERGENGLISQRKWEQCEDVLDRADVLVFSEHDPVSPEEMDKYVRNARLSVVTRAELGADIYEGTRQYHVPAYRTVETDQTGAGDGFAAAFLLEYRRTGSPVEACRFASASASLLIEGVGLEGIGDEESVRLRMRGRTI